MTYAQKIGIHVLAALCVVFLYADVSFAQVREVQLQNPFSFSSIPEFVSRVLKAMVMIALPIISLFMVYSGFLFVMAQGNQEKLSQAKTNFLYVLIGSILILGAWVLASLIGGTITSLTSGT